MLRDKVSRGMVITTARDYTRVLMTRWLGQRAD
jgi:hypothetical protein